MYPTATKYALSGLALVGMASAHTRFTTLYVDGENMGDGLSIRMNMDAAHTVDYIMDITSDDMACGVDGQKAVARVSPAKAGSTLTFEFREYADGSQPDRDAIDQGHKGPCSVMMKKVDDPLADNTAAGDGWFKIYDESYDENAQQWCTNKMVANNGHLSAIIPADLAQGYYLVRPELLALHQANENPPVPQFYVGCAQIFVSSTGTATPPTINIPKDYVTLDTPGMHYDLYAESLALPYPMYGPPVYTAGSSASKRDVEDDGSYDEGNDEGNDEDNDGGNEASDDGDDACEADENDEADGDEEAEEGEEAEGSDGTGFDSVTPVEEGEATAPDATSTTTTPSTSPQVQAETGSNSNPTTTPTTNNNNNSNAADTTAQTIGLRPEGCVVENANWCGIELASYSDENACWAASKQCWQQSDECYGTAPPSGYKGCTVWENKCHNIDDNCNARNFVGPPDQGKFLSETPPALVGGMQIVKRTVAGGLVVGEMEERRNLRWAKRV